MIEVRNLTKKYGNTKVVDNVSLDIEKGKMISLIGPNGAVVEIRGLYTKSLGSTT